MFRWIKTLPDQPPITDKQEIDRLYRYWRIHIMIALYAGYATYYFTRKSFNYVMPEMIKDLGISIADVGILTTAFYLVYGFSRFASGIMSDASNPRFFMGVGLIITGFINIFFWDELKFVVIYLLLGVKCFFPRLGMATMF